MDQLVGIDTQYFMDFVHNYGPRSTIEIVCALAAALKRTGSRGRVSVPHIEGILHSLAALVSTLELAEPEGIIETCDQCGSSVEVSVKESRNRMRAARRRHFSEKRNEPAEA